MAVKIRLQRRGRRHRPFYAIVVADSRAPRDGKFIEKLGTYDPTTTPATIELNFERAYHWLTTGAIPTDTVRAILSYKGVLLWKHLMEGVKKGALTEEQAKEKFEAWKKEKERKIQEKINKVKAEKDKKKKAMLEQERKIREQREKALAEKYAEKAQEEAKEQENQEAETQQSEETTEE